MGWEVLALVSEGTQSALHCGRSCWAERCQLLCLHGLWLLRLRASTTGLAQAYGGVTADKSCHSLRLIGCGNGVTSLTGMSRALLPAATRRENQELKTDAPSGHG